MKSHYAQLKVIGIGILLSGLLTTAPSWADAKKSKVTAIKTEPAKPLILSPSDGWEQQMIEHSASQNPLLMGNSNNMLDNHNKVPSKKIDVGCDVDLRPQSLDNDRLSNRLVGECRLGYNY